MAALRARANVRPSRPRLFNAAAGGIELVMCHRPRGPRRVGGARLPRRALTGPQAGVALASKVGEREAELARLKSVGHRKSDPIHRYIEGYARTLIQTSDTVVSWEVVIPPLLPSAPTSTHDPPQS